MSSHTFAGVVERPAEQGANEQAGAHIQERTL
jgi:hypothetical protein